MTEPMDHLLDPSQFVDDVLVRVWTRTEEFEAWVPERLWDRLVNLGRAYELHRLPLLAAPYEPVTLNAQQCAGLQRELEFVEQVVKDEALRSIRAVVAAAARLTGEVALLVEGP